MSRCGHSSAPGQATATVATRPRRRSPFRNEARRRSSIRGTAVGLLIGVAICCSNVPSAHAAAAPGATIRNRAEVGFTMNGANLTVGSNTDEIVVQSPPLPDDATVGLVVSPSPTHPGDTVVLDITIANSGANALLAGQFIVTGPAGSLLIPVPGGPAVDGTGSTLLSVPDLAIGGSVTVQVELILPRDQPTGMVSISVAYAANGGGMSIAASADLQVVPRSHAVLDALQYAPGSGVAPSTIPPTSYDTGSGFAVFPPPALPGSPGTRVTDGPIELVAASAFRRGQTVFVRLDDADQNKHPATVETIELRTEVHQADGSPADGQTFLLAETGPDTGVFLGYVQTTGVAPTPHDGMLSVEMGSSVRLHYTDPQDGLDEQVTVVLVDPFGQVFDSATGQPIDGVSVSLIDASTDTLATVVGDDGVSGYPSTVITGETVTDGGGTVYDLPEGGFVFPRVTPGNYRFVINLPPDAGYRWPSTIPSAALQTLPGAPFAIDTGSRAEVFAVTAGPPLHLDLPLDPGTTPLWVRKTAGKTDVANGSHLQFRVEVQNTRALGVARSVLLTDTLPHGFRYEPGSTRIDGDRAPDPSISPDGRTLGFSLGDLPTTTGVVVGYVVRVASARPGEAVNRAVARGSGDLISNTAEARVWIREELLRSRAILMGRVAPSDPEPGTEGPAPGVPGVRVYLEDGTYVVTDDRGMFHFEGIRPGSHVVQLDLATLPERYEVLLPEPNTRSAGRVWSRFVDVQGGTLWRVDFPLGLKPLDEGNVEIGIETSMADDQQSLDYRLRLAGTGVPIRNARLTVLLPAGAEYVPGSSRTEAGSPMEPEVQGTVLTFRLGERPREWNTALSVKARMDPTAERHEWMSRATLVFETPTGSSRTPVAEHVTRTEPRPETPRSREFTVRGTFTSFGTSLSDDDRATLRDLTARLAGLENVRITVEGHADNRPIRHRSRSLYADNQALSLARATAVARYLTDEPQWNPSSMTVLGRGAEDPIADNETAEGRALNRRVEVRVVADEPRRVYASSGPSAGEATVSVKTTGMRPGETWQEEETAGDETTRADVEDLDTEAYDETWIEGVKPGFELVFPLADHLPRIPSIHIGIKHDPADRLELLLNGEPVNRLNFERTSKNEAGSVAFSLWRGVDIAQGDNRIQAIATDGDGRETGRLLGTVHYSGPPVRVELVESQSVLIADGLSAPVVAVRLLDRDGYPARRESVGTFRVEPPYRAERETPFDLAVMPGAPPETSRYTVGADGIARIALEPTTETGDVRIVIALMNGEHEIDATLRPQPRDWILVGLVEGNVGYNSLSGTMEPLSGDAAEENLYDGGRVALYAKGRVKGEWLLTLAYDSAKPTGGRQDLYQTIDPGTYYNVYGDGTTQRYDAASREKLYIRIERKQFFALFGDFETGFDISELSRYSRSLTGLKSRYRSGRADLTVFASDSNEAFVKDEIRGQGITGPYRLSRRDIVMNSEKVTIQVRDRFRSEVVLSETSLSRHLDYDIDYDSGWLFFRDAIFATDARLDHVFLVVDYESFDEGDHSLTLGGRAQFDVGDGLRLGLTHVTEGRVGNEARLDGVDLTYDLNPETRARLEYAQTDDPAGDGDAYLAELEHRSEKADARAYYREQGEGFGLGQLNRSESGTRKVGAEGRYRVGEDLSLQGRAFRQESLDTGATREVLEAETLYQREKGSVRGGLRAARDEEAGGGTRSSELLTAGASRKLVDDRLSLRAEREQPIGSGDESVDYPARTRLGLDFGFGDGTTVFAEQEWADGADRDTETTRVGLKTAPWAGSEVSTSINQVQSGETQGTTATLALRQRWSINPQWNLDAGLERIGTLNGADVPPLDADVPFASGLDDDTTATSLGLTYNPGNWLWSTRLDRRESSADTRWGIATSARTDPRSDLGLLFGLRMLDSETASGEDRFTNDLRLGLAYRRPGSRWLLLDRLDWIEERRTGGLFESDERRIVNNLNASYRGDRWQTSLQYGAKFAREEIDRVQYRGYTDLMGVEARFDLTPRWDVGVRGSALRSWGAGQLSYSYGPSIGLSPLQNMWISVGYNLTGFEDDDFSAANATSEGPFLRFRLKFDQLSLREVVGRDGP